MVVVQHIADLEGADYAIGLDPRRGAEGGDVALGRDQRDLPAHGHAQLPRQPGADDHRIVAPEILQRAGPQAVVDGGQLGHVLRPHAPHHHPGIGVDPGIGGHHLPVQHRQRLDNARYPGDAGGGGIIAGHRPHFGLDGDMAGQAQDGLQELHPEPVHHAHHDDEGGHPQGDPDQREQRDDRDEAFLALGAQVAGRDHPLERRENACPAFGLGNRRRRPGD